MIIPLLVCCFFLLLCQLRFAILPFLDYALRRPFSPEPACREWPHVTVQLAVFREHQVLGALLEAVLALDYPKNDFAIQVLDDSVGDDARRTRSVVDGYRERGVEVSYVNRESRAGFKAGALNHGLTTVRSTLVACFDADCLPRPDFLCRTVPYFEDPQVAAVQTRWDFLNATHSPLTMLQAAIFEWIFRFEITLRARLGWPSFFMGTAGVWRSEAIRALGGWQTTPFTAEDLDLAYRAGARGWKVIFQPAALADTCAVEDLLGFRAQQRRWSRAMLRAGVDNFPALVRSRRSWLGKALEYSMALTHSSAVFLLATALFSALAVLTGTTRTPTWIVTQVIFSVAVLASPATTVLIVAQRSYHRNDWTARAWLLLLTLPEAMGAAISLLLGLTDFLGNRLVDFVVTPKGGSIAETQCSRQHWLSQQRGLPFVDGIAGLLIISAACRAFVAYPEAALALTLVGISLLVSAGRTFFAVGRHATRLRGFAPAGPPDTSQLAQ